MKLTHVDGHHRVLLSRRFIFSEIYVKTYTREIFEWNVLMPLAIVSNSSTFNVLFEPET